jgi:Flp pilus assembly protein TadD
MSKTLNFVAHLASQARKYRDLGLNDQAERCWSRLAGMRSLHPAVAEEAQSCLGEIRLHMGESAQACRHFVAALTHNPLDPQYHYMLGSAIEADAKGDVHRALQHYRQAAVLAPDEARYWCALGKLELEWGDEEEGIQALHRAAEVAADDPEILADVADALHSRQSEYVRALLRAALFRHPRDSRFRKLWDDFQFQEIFTEQNRKRHQGDGPPILLPFARAAEAAPAARTVRRDPPGRPGKPHFPGKVSKKHA